MSPSTHSNTLVVKRSRAGRPALQDRLGTNDPDVVCIGSLIFAESTDSIRKVRKERLRIAQRTYRNRKNSTLAAIETRAERLEGALIDTIHSFTIFQNLATKSSRLTPDIALALSKTAIEISSFAHEARLGSDRRRLDDLNRKSMGRENSVDIHVQAESSQYSSLAIQLLERKQFSVLRNGRPSLNPWHLVPTPTFAQLFWLACAERGQQILSSPNTSFSDIHPALSLYANICSLYF